MWTTGDLPRTIDSWGPVRRPCRRGHWTVSTDVTRSTVHAEVKLKKPIVIFGAGGFAREVLALLRDINTETQEWEILGFIDDDVASWGKRQDGVEILGGRQWILEKSRPVSVVIGMGSPALKRKVARDLKSNVAGFPTLVHPSVISTEHVKLGAGVVVTAGNILTSQITVGEFAMLNLSCTVGHDVRIRPYVTISPGCNISGNVEIGEGCNIGTGSSIVQDISIGEWSVIGAGAVVSRDLPANCTAVGVPARKIKERPPRWYEDEA